MLPAGCRRRALGARPGHALPAGVLPPAVLFTHSRIVGRLPGAQVDLAPYESRRAVSPRLGCSCPCDAVGGLLGANRAYTWRGRDRSRASAPVRPLGPPVVNILCDPQTSLFCAPLRRGGDRAVGWTRAVELLDHASGRERDTIFPRGYLLVKGHSNPPTHHVTAASGELSRGSVGDPVRTFLASKRRVTPRGPFRLPPEPVERNCAAGRQACGAVSWLTGQWSRARARSALADGRPLARSRGVTRTCPPGMETPRLRIRRLVVPLAAFCGLAPSEMRPRRSTEVPRKRGIGAGA